jgi:hypothetical protein
VTRQYTAPWVALLAEVLADVPRLPGALCAADPQRHDSADGEGIAAAVALCRRCPCLAACGTWASQQRHLVGVVAGRYRHPRRYDRPDDNGTENTKEAAGHDNC